jgi:hypothetical protein
LNGLPPQPHRNDATPRRRPAVHIRHLRGPTKDIDRLDVTRAFLELFTSLTDAQMLVEPAAPP